MRASRSRLASLPVTALALLVLGSCGGDSPTGSGSEAGPPARVELVSGENQTGTVGVELGSAVVAKVVDEAGHPVKGQLVNFRVASGGGSVFAGSSLTDAQGTARERWTLGTNAGEEQRLEARAVDNSTGAPIVFATFHATATADVARTVQIVTPPPATARSGIALVPQPAVRLTDRFGNVVRQAGAAVEASLAAGDVGHTLSGTTSVVTDADGIAHFTDLALGGTAGTATLRFAMAGGTEGATSAVQMGAGTAAAITKAGGDGQAAPVGTAVAESPRVRITDAAGNPVSGETVTFSVTSGGGRVSSGTVTTDATGVAATTWTLGTTAGANTMTATAGALSVTFSATGTTPGSPTVGIVTQPSPTARSGAAFATVPVVQLRDEFGNALAVSGVVVTATSSVQGVRLDRGTGVPATASTNASGVATFTNLTPAGPAGDFTITFSAPGYSPVTSSSVSLAVGDPAGVGPISPTFQHIGAAEVTTLQVFVNDAGGNRLAGVPITWSLQGGPGALSATSSTTDASGVAGVQFTAPSGIGLDTHVLASGPVGSTELALSVVAGPPRSVVKLTGDNLRAPAGGGIVPAPSVRVTDAGGNRLSNVTVTFAVTSGGGSVTGATRTTDANGVATVSSWALGPTVGATNTLTATAGSASTTFTAVAQSPSILVTIQQPAANALVGDAVPVTATVSSSGAAIASVMAAVGDRSTALTQSATSTATWTGTLSLAGTTLGVRELLVVATDVNGQSTTASVPVRHDAPPTLAAAVLPRNGLLANAPVPIRASCADDGPACTITVRSFDRVSGYGPILAQAQGTLDQSVSLASLDGQRVRLRVIATDTAGQATFEERLVYAEASTRLTPVDSASGTILDVSADRILHGDRYTDATDSLVTLAILGRSSRADAVLAGTQAPGGTLGASTSYSYLTPTGAIWSDNWSSTAAHFREWRDGAQTDLGFAASPTSLRVAGSYALWNNAARLVRRDLTTGTNLQITDVAGVSSNDVAANGDVVFYQSASPSGYNVFRYRGGTITQVSSGCCSNMFPRTDGTRVIWQVDNQIATNDGSGEARLTTANDGTAVAIAYGVDNGWLAYMKRDAATGLWAVWTRSPAGTERMASAAAVSNSLFFEAVGPNGEVVYRLGADRMLALPDQGPVRIGTTLGRPVWIDGALHVVIGGTLLRVTP